MGLFTAIAAYQFGKRRQAARDARDFCDHCGHHRDEHRGWRMLCPETSRS